AARSARRARPLGRRPDPGRPPRRRVRARSPRRRGRRAAGARRAHGRVAGTPADDTDTPRVRVDEARGHHVVTLTRGARHNALDARLRDELEAALADAAAHDTRPIIVRG